MQLNPHYAELNESYLFSTIAHKVADYQKAHPEADVIRLGIGDVTLPLAASVTEAMHKAVEEQGRKETFHGYIPSEQGYEFLREAIQKYYAKSGVSLDMAEIFISDGAKSDLGNLLDLFSQDNTILVPDPVYPVYVDDNVMAGRKILYLPATAGNNFLPMPDEAPHADIVYICSPNNPTGATYSVEQLKAWVDWAKQNDAVILFDAAYECFVTEPGLARSIYQVEGAKEVAIEVCSFSKIAGFTGTRCGYTVVPTALAGGKLNKMWRMLSSAVLPPSLPRKACARSSRTWTTTAPTLPSSPPPWTRPVCGTAAVRTAPTSGCAAPTIWAAGSSSTGCWKRPTWSAPPARALAPAAKGISV